jgi:hypothetical protein
MIILIVEDVEESELVLLAKLLDLSFFGSALLPLLA